MSIQTQDSNLSMPNQITLHFNQCGVSILTDLFTNIYMLNVKFLCVFTILRRYIIVFVFKQITTRLVELQVLRI